MLDVVDRVSDRPKAQTEKPRATPVSANSWTPHKITLKDAWFPLAHDFAVGKKPVRRAVYSHPYFLWRENGALVGSEFHPNERRTCEKSVYTDGKGRYPVMEKYGYVWGWFGRPEAADPVHLPSLPFLPPNGGLPKYMLGTVRFDCAAPLSLENLIDLTHADFLHADVVGDEKSESETVETIYTSETVTMIRTCKAKSVAPVMKFFSGIRTPVQDVRQVIHIYLRSHCAVVYGRFSPGDDVPLFHPCVPETRDRTRLDYAMNTSNAGFMFRHIMPKASYIVSRQDSSMTSPQSPRYMQPTKRRDLHSPLDAAGQRYRLAMQELAQRQDANDYDYHDNVSADCGDLIGLRRELFKY
jgi:phenylpropionate dioxygenase-like ring-hydroxylating dioxygenase large terminal subunit